MPDQNIDVDFSNEVMFSLVDEQSTRADVTSLTSFNVLCVTGNMGSSESTKFNTAFTRSGSYYMGGKFWPSSNPSYSFYASNNAITPSYSGAYVSVDGSTDVVVAYNKFNSSLSNYKTVIPLTFIHVFAKIGYCKVVAPTDYTVSNLNVTFNPYYKGNYYIYNGSWTKNASKSVLLANALNSENVNGSYIIPGTYTINISYTLTKGSYTESFVKTVDLSFIFGRVNNVVLQLPEGNPYDNPGGTVVPDPWEEDEDIIL